MNKKFQKGEWVVFLGYNKYPVQLEESEQLGFIDCFITGPRFFKSSEEQMKELRVTGNIRVRDPRQGIITGEGWVERGMVRYANSTDMDYLIDLHERNMVLESRELEKYLKIKKELFND